MMPTPARPPSAWAWSNAPGVLPDEQPGPSYEILRDTITNAFNPPDDDVAEERLMTTTLDRVWAFLVALPCRCCQGVGETCDPCARCDVLGRHKDTRLER